MATKNENRGHGWLDFDLKEEFDKESFEKLSEYSKNQQIDLMRIWLCGNKDEIHYMLRQGTAVLNYFEHAIGKDYKSLTAFQLGVLAGHLACLNTITYEKHQNELANLYFENAKSALPNYSNLFEKVITYLYYSKMNYTSTKKLMKELSLEEQEVRNIMRELMREQLVHYGVGYILTDIGIRVAMQLSKQTKDS